MNKGLKIMKEMINLGEDIILHVKKIPTNTTAKY